ncbi:MAG: major capsid protein [Microviridae sp.]|nr:MAG: major capsid protein [Microviridae sp.]
MKKTLGGDRLGAGKKMKVHLHGYERSTQNLGYIWRSTMAAGTLVPFLVEPALPGDTFDIDLDCDIKTHPTIGPLFGSYKVQLDIFECPMRLYQAKLHNNALGIGLKMNTIKLPQMELLVNSEIPIPVTDPDNCQINPSCILSYLNIRGIGIPGETGTGFLSREFNAIPFIALWDIYKNYYANKQEEIGAVIHNDSNDVIKTVDQIFVGGAMLEQAPGNSPMTGTGLTPIEINYSGALPKLEQIIVNTSKGNQSFLQLGMIPDTSTAGTIKGFIYFYPTFSINYWDYIQASELPVTPPKVVTFPLENIDKMRNFLLSEIDNPNAILVNSLNLPPYNLLLNWTDTEERSPYLNTQEGLPIKTYQSDLFNNWLQTEWMDGVGGINEITSVDTSSGNFEINSLILAKKVYNMLNRIAVSGGTYDDWQDTVYDHERHTVAETPIYQGGLIKELIFQEVVSNSDSTNGEDNQPLGTLAGKGAMSKKHKGGKVTVRVNEPSYIIGIISLTPRLDYSQGNKWDTGIKTMDDWHKPALDEIGFQELITEQMAWWDTQEEGAGWKQNSAGKQPAWINYMTNVNQVRGNFAIKDNEDMMVLLRRYEMQLASDPTHIKDLTTYIDPTKFNHIFAQTSLDAQNFWVQIATDITARRKMSAKIMPNL